MTARPEAGTCRSDEHTVHRRRFLQGVGTAGLASVVTSFAGLFSSPTFAQEVRKRNKRCILLWLCGAPSQFETWDPKPGRPSAGPFGTVPTEIPGVRFSSLLPRCASMAGKLAVVRSMKTAQSEHFQAISLLQRGNPDRPGFTRPTLGSVVGHALGQVETKVPNFILLDPIPGGNEFQAFKAGNWAGWLGAEYGPVRMGGEYTQLGSAADGLTPEDRAEREGLRKFLAKKFENERRSAAARSQNAVFERVRGLMSCADLFDLNRLPERDRQRYGPGMFGLNTLQARHLVENGCPFVMVANGMNWDNHVFQHEIHQMLVPELDRILLHLVNDLEERSMLDDTLVIAMGEFGRTPWLNAARGRDHYPNAWSLMMCGGGIRGGVVTGATDEDGREVVERPYSEQNLFATIFMALGLDPHAEYGLPGLPTFHRVENDAPPIREILL
ncbi:MAG: hypothetical protein RLZZ179_1711 [Verrucomicrobiota bacterium]